MNQTILTSGKKFETLQKKLKARNAAFRKLPKAQQRVAIAEDVIAQLRLKKFVADSTYFSWGDRIEGTNVQGTWSAKEADLDLSVCISQVQCSVCGIGSLFAGAVLNADKLKLNDFTGDRREEVEYLQRWFTKKQLDLVECFYERWDYSTRYDFNILQFDGEREIYLPHTPIFGTSDPTKRLKKIMENIVSNGGKFDPFKGKHGIKS